MLKEEAAELADLFRLVDKDGGGTISMDEFLELLQSMSVRPSIHEMQLLYEEIDGNGNGAIEMDEFMAFMDDSRISNKCGRDELLAAFAMFEDYAAHSASTTTSTAATTAQSTHRDEHVRREDVMAAVMEYASDHIHVGRTERATVTEDRRERDAGGGGLKPSSKATKQTAHSAAAAAAGTGVVLSAEERRRVVEGLLDGLPWGRDGYLDYHQFVLDNTKERRPQTARIDAVVE